MSYLKPSFRHPQLPKNGLGLTRTSYEGLISTLCAGCGHDSISAAVIQAVWELDLEPHRIAKMSGIGCSSKSPTYFLNKAHGFNSVHGRMPSVATGASVANHNLSYIGVSGDGDSASIGMGQFAHVVRRNLNMLYLVENNGCYGLTKGQDSATSDEGSRSRTGNVNPFENIDLVGVALELGATFVARSFSGDKTQLVPLMKAAMSHKGFALIDVISPCVTFNNHHGSTKSYDYTREHVKTGNIIDFVPSAAEITVHYEEGEAQDVQLHDGSRLNLVKAQPDYNPENRREAINALQDSRENGEILTGLIYIDADVKDFHSMMNMTDKPLNELTGQELCPGEDALRSINRNFS
ncbi:MAG: 2-oxoacid:ferredoxin oxidoreductase subunit beta [Granulosicoccus sp.]|nr:2-oxoacid:ferredoxin oxidoreductase subunit beta [Granulosicoccus sp.]